MAAPLITKEELKQLLESGPETSRPIPVDARLKYPYEHSTVKLPGAVRVSPAGGALPDLPKARPLVVYCSDPDELTSQRVAAKLIAQGYRASVLKGGVSEWIAANLPTESRQPTPQA
jgi:rhodanese-related sulfurtransferase